ncbi:Ig-specific serine endopeptidase MIP [Mycoplasma sp. OR1901]|uniref:Ig-specific serine endopeptidase MIP n=1 Tax=Mycoplasma sp. OR1901 TaxID=2742195 RepID=UPI0015821B1F|nr:DUF31 family protein [Mycoplasma sp. OR1901]QKT05245.1 hypothetical protein HTZ87_00795 [Mycoplasma sp. OR1901]
MKKIILTLSSLTILGTAISCGTTQNINSKNKTTPTTTSPLDKSKELASELASLSGESFDSQINDAKDATTINSIIKNIQEQLEKEVSPERIKEKANELLRKLPSKQEFKAKLESNEPKKLLNTLKEIITETQKPISDENINISKSKFAELKNNFNETEHFSFSYSNKPKEQSKISEILTNQSSGKIIPNEDYAWFLDVNITNIKRVNGNNDSLEFYLILKNKLTNEESDVKKVVLSGFLNDSQDQGHIIQSKPIGQITEESEIIKYIKMSPIEKFNHDDTPYTEALRRSFGDISNSRSELSNSDSNVEHFNEKAKSVGFINYNSAALKGYTLPKYDSSNKVLGLALNEKQEIGKKDSWVDSLNKPIGTDTGLARRITNKNYLQTSYSTYQVNINNILATEDEEEKKRLRLHVKNPERLVEFAAYVQDDVKKKDFIRRIKEAHGDNDDSGLLPNEELLREIAIEIFDELWTQYNSEERAKQDYTNYINKYKKIVIKRIEDDKQIKPKTLENAKRFINKASTMWDIQNRFVDSESVVSGTMWIMDYELTNDGSYPTKFYFGTNLHVADAIIPGSFSGMSINVINKENVTGNFQAVKMLNVEGNYHYKTGIVKKEAVDRVYDAKDYLDTTPSQYLIDSQKSKYKNVEEFLDFSIIEIDFSKFDQQYLDGKSHSEFAKWITNGYANWDAKDKAKFKQNSYLKDYDQINNPISTTKNSNKIDSIDQLIILGYPKSKSDNWFDFFVEKYEEYKEYEALPYGYSLWTNADGNLYGKKITEEGFDPKTQKQVDRGNFLSYNVAWRSFIDKPGITDAFITTPTVGAKPKPYDNLYVSNDGKKYILYGLEYLPRNYVPGGGASGSSIRTKNNELVSVYHASFFTAKTGLSSAFRSEGYDYKGLFGDYNLPQYDLIYGGGNKQKTSYRQKLIERKSKPTWLFPNNFEIPEEFKFKKVVEYTPVENSSDIK